jgi:PPOX class F420-dependent enzyme/OxyR family protein
MIRGEASLAGGSVMYLWATSTSVALRLPAQRDHATSTSTRRQPRCCMSAFTDHDLTYLAGERRLARVATVGRDGRPHVVPVGWAHDPGHDATVVGGHALERTKKYRDVLATGRAAIVIDDLASVDPWRRAASRSAAAPRLWPNRPRRFASTRSGSSRGAWRTSASASGTLATSPAHRPSAGSRPSRYSAWRVLLPNRTATAPDR